MEKKFSLWVHSHTVLKKLIMELKIAIFIIVVSVSNVLTIASVTEPQQNRITGTVIEMNGTPLPGVNVVVTGTTLGTMTDIAGKYSIEVPDGTKSLTFTFVGMQPQEINIGTLAQINVTMAESAFGLEEVVVIGYGTVKKSDLTGSVSSVTSEALSAYPTLGATQAIQGRIAGVMVTTTTGEPGVGSRIRIRGGTSINASSDPLYVVDGFAGGVEPPAEDIESIEILKDASATAIYGSRGANGVVLITTKSGKLGKTKIDFNSSYSTQQVGKKLDLLNGQQFAEYINEVYSNDGQSNIPLPNPEQYGKGTNWQDQIFRTGVLQNYQLSANGGQENFKFYSSVNYYDNEGIVINSNYKRISGTTNLDIKINDHVKFGTKNYFMRTTDNGARSASENEGTGVIASAMRFEPIQGVYDENGNYTIATIGDPIDNQVANAREKQNNTVSDLFQQNSFVEIDFLKDFVFRSTVGFNILNGRNGIYIPTTLNAGRNTGGSASISSVKNTIILNENYLTYNKTINESNKINLMAGYSYQSSRAEYWNASNQNFITNSFSYWNLGAGSVFQSPSSGLTEWTLASFYGHFSRPVH